MDYYEVLGVPREASEDQVREAYLAKSERMNPGRFSTAPAEVVDAAKRASVVIEAAWHVLGDSTLRAEYDADLAIGPQGDDHSHARRLRWRQRHAEHVWSLERNLGVPPTSVLGLRPPRHQDRAPTPQGLKEEPRVSYSINDTLVGVANWLAPHGKRSHEVLVPDVCGLLASEAFYVVSKADLRIEFVRLTEHPAGDGIIVDQSPAAGSVAKAGATVTVQAVYKTAG